MKMIAQRKLGKSPIFISCLKISSLFDFSINTDLGLYVYFIFIQISNPLVALDLLFFDSSYSFLTRPKKIFFPPQAYDIYYRLCFSFKYGNLTVKSCGRKIEI